MSFKFLNHKRKFTISIGEELLTNEAKRKIFKKMKESREREFKDELSEFKSFLQFIKQKINNKDFTCKYEEELAKFISKSNKSNNIVEEDKNCSISIIPADYVFLFKYKKKNEPENIIYFFNEPRILGTYFNSKLINVELAFSPKEIMDFNKRL